MWWVYLIKSKKEGSLYVGLTKNLRRRLQEHNSGNTFSTKNKGPWEFIYGEVYKSFEDAEEREDNLKLHKKALTQLKKRISKSLNI